VRSYIYVKVEIIFDAIFKGWST